MPPLVYLPKYSSVITGFPRCIHFLDSLVGLARWILSAEFLDGPTRWIHSLDSLSTHWILSLILILDSLSDCLTVLLRILLQILRVVSVQRGSVLRAPPRSCESSGCRDGREIRHGRCRRQV